MPVEHHAADLPATSPALLPAGASFNTGAKTIALVVRQNTDGIAEPVRSIIDFPHGKGRSVSRACSVIGIKQPEEKKTCAAACASARWARKRACVAPAAQGN